ncbi:glutathione S-transferase U17-like [Humulus lupulus]|uniref:glutathione S-transferase U17-like n=1 Tax=Humulus lupulus TaxID=3486 RepID=UPI002B40CBCA|nr:glutathione S-transferase U17-like [Humulus lupulus]
MEGSEVKLLGMWASPFVLRVRIALNLKQVQYEYLDEIVGTKSELLLQSNPVHKKVPVLIHAGIPIAESLVIIQYIDDSWASSGTGPSILPSDPVARAFHRFWAAYVDEKFFPAMRGTIIAPTEEGRKLAEEHAKTGIQHLEEAFIKLSKGKAFFGGDHIGFLDIAFGCCLGWVENTEITTGLKLIDEATTPHLAVWAQHFLQHPAVSAVMPEKEKLLEFSKMLYPKHRARLLAQMQLPKYYF